MTRYTELWKAFLVGEGRRNQAREEAWAFAGGFVEGLIAFLGCPRDAVRVYPVGAEIGSTTIYTTQGALELDPDVYWSMQIGLTIRNPELGPTGSHEFFAPQAGFMLTLSFRKEGEVFLIRRKDEKHARIQPSSSESFIAFYEELYSVLEELLEAGLGLDPKKGPARIGF